MAIILLPNMQTKKSLRAALERYAGPKLTDKNGVTYRRDPNDGALRPVEEQPPIAQSDADFLRAHGFKIPSGQRIKPD